jgi:hypothetical protein
MRAGRQVAGGTAAAAAPLVLILVCGCLISLLTFGVRSSFGLFTQPVSSTYGWSREVFALAMAIQNLAWASASRSAARSPTASARHGCSPVAASCTPSASR